MTNTRLLAALPLLLALPAVGCKEYYSVDEACPNGFIGGKKLSPVEEDAMLRVNCYRRLAGVAKGAANEQLTMSARNTLNYALLNPNIESLGGEQREHYWLLENQGSDGFTGYGLYERLSGPEGVGYQFYDLLASDWWEYIDIVWNDGSEELPSGADAIDYLMRNPEFRQAALQPSMLDGAYAELDLPETWFEGWEASYPESPPPAQARIYYYAVVYTAPHIEHANQPVLFPKEDQIEVPLWAPSSQLVGATGQNAITGYPVTFQVGTIDPAFYNKVDQNQYAAILRGATIQDPDGNILETRNVLPDVSAPLGTLPSGRYLRNTLSVVPLEPLQPSTKYSVFAELETPEATFSIEYDFTTAKDDLPYQGSIVTTGTPTTSTTPYSTN